MFFFHICKKDGYSYMHNLSIDFIGHSGGEKNGINETWLDECIGNIVNRLQLRALEISSTLSSYSAMERDRIWPMPFSKYVSQMVELRADV